VQWCTPADETARYTLDSTEERRWQYWMMNEVSRCLYAHVPATDDDSEQSDGGELKRSHTAGRGLCRLAFNDAPLKNNACFGNHCFLESLNFTRCSRTGLYKRGAIAEARSHDATQVPTTVTRKRQVCHHTFHHIFYRFPKTTRRVSAKAVGVHFTAIDAYRSGLSHGVGGTVVRCS
jgi:hypothetical protein